MEGRGRKESGKNEKTHRIKRYVTYVRSLSLLSHVRRCINLCKRSARLVFKGRTRVSSSGPRAVSRGRGEPEALVPSPSGRNTKAPSPNCSPAGCREAGRRPELARAGRPLTRAVPCFSTIRSPHGGGSGMALCRWSNSLGNPHPLPPQTLPPTSSSETSYWRK